MSVSVELEVLDGEYAVSQLAVGHALPPWAIGEGIANITCGDDELSIVCRAERVPGAVRSERGWTALKLAGSFAFDETGVLLAVIRPLSENGIGIFAISTFHRDYLLVKRETLAQTRDLLEKAGHRFS